MKVLICGSRYIVNCDRHVRVAMKQLKAGWGIQPDIVIHGGAIGVDRAGGKWGHESGLPVQVFPADWDRLGKRAGFVRNIEMIEECDLVVAVWNGISKGTKHTIDYATKRGRPVFVYNPQWEELVKTC